MLSLPEFAIGLVENAPVLVLDTETTGLDPHQDRICGWVFATGEHSLYIPVRHTGGGNTFDDPAAFERRLAYAFAKRARLGFRTVGHNLPFDLWFAAKQGVIIGGRLEDTLLNALLIYDDYRGSGPHGDGPYSLAMCAMRAKVPAKRGAELYDLLKHKFKLRVKGPKTMQAFHLLSGADPMAIDYAKGDGTTTFALWRQQQGELDRDDLRKVHALECTLLPYVAKMRRRGIRVDIDYAARAKMKLDNDIMAAETAFPPGFKPNATADVKAWMVANGIMWNPRTRKGNDSFREDFLDESNVGQRINELRRMLKTRSTFVDPILFTHTINSRIHPDLVQFSTGEYGTHTGRFSCRMPNLQAYPKRRKEIGKVVRPILVADPGMVFGEADVSQQEPRLYAHYGQDERLIKGYNAIPPVDIHTLASQHMKIDRDHAKTLGLSILNGMQGASLGRRLKIPRIQADNLMEDFLDTFPGVKLFRREAWKVARDRGFIYTILGRRCYFTDPDMTYMAVSRVIQGSAADQMKLLLLRACEYEDAYPADINVLMTIHDSVMFQSRKGADLYEFERVLNDNRVLNLEVPMPVELATGRHWGETSYGAKAYVEADT